MRNAKLTVVAEVEALSVVVTSSGGAFEVRLPARGAVSIGRSVECEVRIEDAKASRKHAQLRVGETIQIIDLESRNGTQVGETRLLPHEAFAVDLGARIAIGSTVLVIQRASPDARATAGPHDEERARILAALEKCAGNQTHAAKLLGISRRTLVSRLGEYALPRPRKRR
jgi:pSer/pThr/pTyr-binding forkhead associated (FHA) protein